MAVVKYDMKWNPHCVKYDDYGYKHVCHFTVSTLSFFNHLICQVKIAFSVCLEILYYLNTRRLTR